MSEGFLHDGDRGVFDAVVARAQEASQDTPFERWLRRLPAKHLALVHQGGPDAAGAFLVAQARALSSPRKSRFVVAVVAGLIDRWGWDPDGPMPGASQSWLDWLIGHASMDGRSALPPVLRWPTTPDSFRAFDQAHRPEKTVEWLLAWIVATVGPTCFWGQPEAIRRAIESCMLEAHPGVVLQLLTLPGAPTLREALDAPVSRHVKVSRKDGQLLDALRERMTFPDWTWNPRYPRSLERTLATVAMGDPGCVFSVDEAAAWWFPFPVFRALADGGRWSVADGEAIAERLEGAKPESRPRDGIYRRLALLPQHRWPEGEALDREAAAMGGGFFQALWTPKEHRRGASWDDPAVGRGTRWLHTRIAGAPPGDWRVLDLLALDALQEATYVEGGCDALAWGRWFFRKNERLYEHFKHVHQIPAAWKGGMPVLLHDLGNGLPSNGFWALVALGKVFPYPDGEQPYPLAPEGGMVTEDLATEAGLLGVEDWVAWAKDTREAAVTATAWLLTNTAAATEERQDFARKALASIWAQALRRFPSWLDDRPDLLARMLDLLGEGQHLRWENLMVRNRLPQPHYAYDRKLGSAWALLMAHVSQHPRWTALGQVPLDAQPDDDRAVALALLLGHHHPDGVARVCDWLEATRASPAELARLQAWLVGTAEPVGEAMASDPTYRLTDAHRARLRQALWAQDLPEAPGTVRARL